MPAGNARIVTRDVLAAAWRLFQVCLPRCLPLAVLAVVVGGAPSAESAGDAHGPAHDRQWWGLLAACTVLVLTCYGALLRQQLALASAQRPPILDSVKEALRDVPGAFVLVVASILPFVPAAIWTAWHRFDGVSLLLTSAATGLAVFGMLAWPAMLGRGISPWAALAFSARHVRGRWLQVAGVVAVLFVAVLIFMLLAGILLGMVMNLAGQGINPSATALAFSRWLMALVLAVPVVYVAAVVVVLYRSIHSAVASTSAAMQ
jgi:hypothetical protein